MDTAIQQIDLLSMGINWDEPSSCAPDFDVILLGRFEDGSEDCDGC